MAARRTTAVVETPAEAVVETVETPAAEVETPAVEAPATEPAEEPASIVIDATLLDAEVNAAYADLLPFLVLGKRKDRKLNVEVRSTPEPRMRMLCSWGRKSYFAVIGQMTEDGLPVIPAQVKVALLRQIDREYGRAIRVIKADEKLGKKLTTLLDARKAAGKEVPAEETAEPAEG